MAADSSSLRDYVIRRLMLIPVTMLGALLLVYLVIRMAPGQVEKDIQNLMQASSGDKAARSNKTDASGLRPEDVFRIQEDFQRDRPVLTGFLTWAGIVPRETWRTAVVFEKDKNTARVKLKGSTTEVDLTRNGNEVTMTGPEGVDLSEWRVRLMSPDELKKRWSANIPKSVKAPDMPWRAMVYKPSRDGLLQGSLGYSQQYGESVWKMIRERMPVSLFFGILSTIIIYGISIPLGIAKALRHRSTFDSLSSVLIFAGYAIPSYVLGSLLLYFFSAQLGWFPLRDFTSENFDSLGFFGKVADVLHHGALPLICYVAGGFAVTTIMMKNNLMDNLAADYMRTAVAKGVPYRRAVFRHALRNSLIPLATTIGGLVSVFMTGNFLVEKIFDINGIGLLVYNATLQNDDPLILGIIAVSSMLMLLGNIISDIAVALVDPRVSYK